MNYSIENRDQLLELVKIISEKVVPAFYELCQIQYPDEEEKKLKAEYAKLIKKTMPVLDTLYFALNEKLFQQAKDLTLNAKLQGEKGDEQLLELYLKLKNSYQEALKEGLREN